jgi:hypothetical protein
VLRCYFCRSRRATLKSLAAHVAESGHPGPCGCGGYPFPHRRESPCCDHNPYVRFHRSRREGAGREEQLDAWIEDALFGDHPPPKDQTCPF